MEDFIGIKRRINEHWIYKDSQYFHAWFEILRSARYVKEPKTDIYEGIVYTINYAEFIFGRPSWSKRLNIPEQKLRTLIKQLLSADMIVLKKKHSKFTIYKIVNYEKYNQQDNHVPDIERSSTEGEGNQQDNHQLTSSQPSANHQLTNKEEGKEREEGKEGKSIVPYQKIMDLYNSTCKSLAKIKAMTDSRKDKAKIRWSEMKTLEAFQELFIKTEATPFCKGDNPKSWRVTFDWLMENDRNYLKVLEGAYDKQQYDSTKDW